MPQPNSPKMKRNISKVPIAKNSFGLSVQLRCAGYGRYPALVPVEGEIFEKFKDGISSFGFVGNNQLSPVAEFEQVVAVRVPIGFIGEHIHPLDVFLADHVFVFIGMHRERTRLGVKGQNTIFGIFPIVDV